MNPGFLAIKSILLTLTLVIVVLIMLSLRNDGLSETVRSFFGASASQVKLNWCETRVKSIETANGFKMTQSRMRWMQEKPIQKELDGLAVEKWFGQNCKVPIELAEVRPTNVEFQSPAAMSVEFIQGGTADFIKAGMGAIRFKNRTFTSPELQQAIKDLEQLPEAKKHN